MSPWNQSYRFEQRSIKGNFNTLFQIKVFGFTKNGFRSKFQVTLKGVMNQKMPYFAYCNDAQHLVCLSRNRMYVNLMNLESGDCITTFKAGEDRFLNSLLVSGDGRYVIKRTCLKNSSNHITNTNHISLLFPQNSSLWRWDTKTVPAARLALVAAQTTLRLTYSASWFHYAAQCNHPRRIVRLCGNKGIEWTSTEFHRRLWLTKWNTVQKMETFV